MYLEAKYQLIKSSWGISVLMGATGIVVSGPPVGVANHESTGDNVIVRNKSGLLLTSTETRLLSKAVERVKPLAREKLGTDHIIIDITRLEFSHCDYQEEGIYAVFIRWFTQFFALQDIEVPAIYDESSNRYVFQLG